MISQLEVETKPEAVVAEGREVYAPRRWAQPAVCVSILAVAGVCVVVALGQASAGVEELVINHVEVTAGISDSLMDPCVMVRYMCKEAGSEDECDSAGNYCSWAVNPVSGEGTCIKAARDSNDFCAVHRTHAGCLSGRAEKFGCVWKAVDPSIIAKGGYCIEGEDSQSGCDLNIFETTCEMRDDCEWVPDSEETQRRLQVAGVGGVKIPGGFPGSQGPSGHCWKKKTKDDCCTELGPTKDTCNKVSSVCQWNSGAEACEANGDVPPDIQDGVNKGVEEICHYQFSPYACRQQDLVCGWDPATNKCEPKV